MNNNTVENNMERNARWINATDRLPNNGNSILGLNLEFGGLAAVGSYIKEKKSFFLVGDKTPISAEYIKWLEEIPAHPVSGENPNLSKINVVDALNMVEDMYGSVINHPFHIGDCVLAKYNALDKDKIRKIERKVSGEKAYRWVKGNDLPIEKYIIVRHPHGVEAVIFIRHRWRYWYSGAEVSLETMKSITEWSDPLEEITLPAVPVSLKEFDSIILIDELESRGIAVPVKKVEEEHFMPPDNGDACWRIGANDYTRKEVAYLLYTQRAMIGNDLKSKCGNDMTSDMFDVIKNPRMPEF